MSILLDALRRSEAQRQLGQPPSIHAGDIETDMAGLVWVRYLPMALSVITVVVIAWIGIVQFGVPEDVGSATDNAADTSGATAQSTEHRPVKQPPDQATAKPEGATEGDPEVLAMEAAKRERLARRFGAYKDKDAARPADNSRRRPRPASAEQASETADFEAPGRSPDEATERAMQRNATALAGTRGNAPERYEPELMSYWGLPQSVRDEISEVKITVLVYAENPQDRFLLVNGQRLLESEELSVGLLLEEIRRDGAVFSFRNYRFLMER